jgi:hypothetical protein
MAYCLLGLFGISTPMLYGEGGERAFMRLQEEIIKESNDMSIFAWKQAPSDVVIYHADTHSTSIQLRGILARSPTEFLGAHYHNLSQGKHNTPEYAMTNKGLRIKTRLEKLTSTKFCMYLNCSDEVQGDSQPQASLGVILQDQGEGVYARTEPDKLQKRQLVRRHRSPDDAIYIQKHSLGTAKWAAEVNSQVDFRFTYVNERSSYDSEVMDKGPRNRWDATSEAFTVTPKVYGFACYERVAWGSKTGGTGEFVVVTGLEPNTEPWMCIFTAESSPHMYRYLEAKDMVRLAKFGKLNEDKRLVLKSTILQSSAVHLSMKKSHNLRGKEVRITFTIHVSFYDK